MICERCNNEHNGSFASGQFCSRACSNARTFSPALRNQIRTKLKSKPRQSLPSKTITPEHRAAMLKGQIDKLASKGFDEVGWHTKKKRVLEEQGGSCADCSLSTWRGEKLILEIEHIDGDRFNNERQNLKAICPNCHSLTTTWRGRKNVGRQDQGRRKVSEAALRKALQENATIADALRAVGLVPRGANYMTARKLLEKERGSGGI